MDKPFGEEKHREHINIKKTYDYEQRFIDCKAYTATIHNATGAAYRSK